MIHVRDNDLLQMQKPQVSIAEYSLIPVTMDCFAALCELLWEPEVREFLCDNVNLPSDTIQAFIERSVETDDKGQGLWAIQEGAEFLGIVGLRMIELEIASNISKEHSLETMVALTRAAWGRGIAWRALEEIHTFARHSLGIPSVYAIIDLPNFRSRKLFERLGYIEITDDIVPDPSIVIYQKHLID